MIVSLPIVELIDTLDSLRMLNIYMFIFSLYWSPLILVITLKYILHSSFFLMFLTLPFMLIITRKLRDFLLECYHYAALHYTVLHYATLHCTALTFIYISYALYILHIVYTGEMLNGRPVFPGTSTMNQIERVIQVTQMPSKADIEAVASPFAATMLETLPVMNYKTIPQTFPSATEDGLDVLRSCFHFNPDKRPSAEELLRHDFVSDFHNEEEEPNFPGGEE